MLKLWQGLGYYSRARNLHQAARNVVEQRKGEMPRSYEDLLKMKGVGNYTASAIASICFKEPRAVVDGNVSRVIARVFGLNEPINSTSGNKMITALAHEMLDRDDPGTHNQAIMEFGALQCVPVSPQCDICPLMDHCEARATGRVEILPVKIPKRKPVERWMHFYILLCNGETIITRRENEGIWKSLYQFPLLESDTPLNDKEAIGPALVELIGGTGSLSGGTGLFTIRKISDPIRHQLTHRTIHARFIHVNFQFWPQHLPAGWFKISLDQLDDFAVPRLINRYMEVAKF